MTPADGRDGATPLRPGASASLVLPPALSSVGTARRWVGDALADWSDDSLQGVLIVVSELVGNAVLHARTEVRVAIGRHDPVARIEVSDGSSVVPLLKRYGPESPTGRGLHLIELLSEEWGVRTGEHGKTIWAVMCDRASPAEDLAPHPTGEASRVSPATGAGVGPPSESLDPADRPVSVRLLGLPVETYFETQEHHDEVLRELALLSGSRRDVPEELGRLAREIREAFLPATAEARAQLDAAASRERGTVDVTLSVARRSLEAFVHLSHLLEQIDRFCFDAALLTLAAGPQVTRVRRWYSDQVAAQLEGGEPTPWSSRADA